MKIILAPDSFKGSMSSMKTIQLLEKTASSHFPDVEIIKVPIADGGEGTVEALVTATKGEYRQVEVTGPLEKKVIATYGVINGKTAVLEMAQASGLPLLKSEERNPLLTTTYGTGELIKAVLDQGIRDIIIGIGGSATNDGGIGASQALGIRFCNSEGREVGFGGGELSRITAIDLTDMDPRIRESNITVICDVSNPLTGPTGATFIFGPQKGAAGEILEVLEAGMKNYARIAKSQLGLEIDDIPGAGAAGGLGAALVGFMGAKLKSGIETVLDFVEFDRLLEGADLVVTGEGRIDGQSVFGKVPVGVAKRCRQKGVSTVAIVGSIGPEAHKVYEFGIDSIISAVSAPIPLEEALSRSEELFCDAADRMFRMIKVGMKL